MILIYFIYRPKNELDRLLMDDNEEADMLSTQKKPWQPPQFKQFSAESEVSRYRHFLWCS